MLICDSLCQVKFFCQLGNHIWESPFIIKVENKEWLWSGRKIDKCAEERPRVVRIMCQSSLVYLLLVLMKDSFLFPTEAVTFEWQEQERGLATRMTIEGRKHASLADVKDIFLFSVKGKLKDFYWHLNSVPFSKNRRGGKRDWPKNLTRKRKSNEVQKWKKGEYYKSSQP